MRRIATTCVVLCSLAVSARAADVLSQLGITLDLAKQAVDSVINSGVYQSGLPAGRVQAAAAGARGEAASAGVAWLKTYTASPAFKQQVRPDSRVAQARAAGVLRHA